MSVLVVVSLMNLVWMALLSLIFPAEKHWRYGAGLTRGCRIDTHRLG